MFFTSSTPSSEAKSAIAGSPAAVRQAGFVPQHTLAHAVECVGVGLHSGLNVTMTLKPAEPDRGVVFRRIDVAEGSGDVPARFDNVIDTRMCTTLGNRAGVTVGTTEHLMAAFAGLGVDNAIVELNGPEVPIMDGSSAPFVFLVECAGLAEQAAPRRVIRVVKDVGFSDGPIRVSLSPSDHLSLDCEIDFKSAAVARQSLRLGLVNGAFRKELARARTFGFLEEVEQLRALGLARGGSLENAIVVHDGRVLNEGGLRYDDEFVRHKALDALGDLYMAGAPIIGAFKGIRSGHAANNRLLHALFADSSAWRREDLSVAEAQAAEISFHARAAAE
ncbi:MAG: UDP-3-O-acyl-N-acetylglucosamine deacetylase [Alphaproteobacteria bacterium]|nr:UDP-3-O-acyl-N-acetylglucosamine deacetylase [Alphaproteobacteria bacterium]